jgi:hypothetical protein
MPYLLYKTNGQVLTTIDDSNVDISTSLNLIGKNYAGYGLAQNENFVYLLENFSNRTPPAKPIVGQTWFDSTPTQNKLKIYDGAEFKGLATIRIQKGVPATSVIGDLWWDTQNQLLKTFDGSIYQVIGPSLSIRANWLPSDELKDDYSPTITILKGSIGNKVIAVVSETEFTPYKSNDLDVDRFPLIKKGITLAGASATGSTTGTDYYFWGTAAESLVSLVSNSVSIGSTSTNGSTSTLYVPLANTLTGNAELISDLGIEYIWDPVSQSRVLQTVASSARFADLAERYAADAVYDVGTVVVIGGDKEVTTSCIVADPTVVGIVSKNPAYRMNSDAGNDETHPYIALKGRVPCKVVGSVQRGDLLVTSSEFGYAQAYSCDDHPCAVIGKALESHSEGFGIIEVLVV